MTTVVGLDLSLSITGFARIDSDGAYDHQKVRGCNVKKFGEIGRLKKLTLDICSLIGSTKPDLVVLEAPSLGHGRQMAGKFHERAGMWWLVALGVLEFGEATLASVPPATLKAFATSNGRAEKSDMMGAAVKVWPNFYGDDNECDALWLAEMGLCHLGKSDLLAGLDKKQLKALSSANWNLMEGCEEL